MGGGKGIGGLRPQKVQQIQIDSMSPESAPPKTGRLGAHSVKVSSSSGTLNANLAKLLAKSDPSRHSIGNDSKASLNMRKVQVNHVRNVERKLSGDEVRTTVDREIQSHIDQLKTGLLARACAPLDPRVLSNALAEIRKETDNFLGPKSLFGQKPLPGLLKSIDKAQAKLDKARAKLTGINCQKLGVAKVVERLKAFAAAQSDLGVAVTDFNNCLRGKVGGSQCSNEKLLNSLGTLDDRVEAAARDTAKVEGLVRSMRLMQKGAPLPDELSGCIDGLITKGKVVSSETLKEAAGKIEAFCETFRRLFGVIASLDNASAEEALADEGHPAPTAAERLDALEAAFRETHEELAGFEKQPGIDGRALDEFKENFKAIEKRVKTLHDGLTEQYAEDAVMGLEAILSNGIDTLRTNKHLSREPVAMDMVAKFDGYLKKIQDFRLSAKPLVDELKNENSALRVELERIVDKLKELAHINVTANQVLCLSGAHIFGSRLKAILSDLKGESIASPATAINSQLLGDVIRGELDLLNYLELKQSDLPVEMLRTELVPQQIENGTRRNHGSFNTVEFVPAINTRQRTSATYVIKPHEKTADLTARGSVAKFFSKYSHARNVAKLNFASKLSAQLIGCGSQITSNGVVRHRHQFMLIQEKATGSTAEEAACQRDMALVVHDASRSSDQVLSIRGGLKSLPPATRARAAISLQVEFAKLEWADWLSGQLDRHLNNLIFNVNVEKTKDGQTRVYSEVKGIDNDASFPEGRPTLGTFTSVEPVKNVQYAINDEKQREDLIDEKGLRSARRPTVLPLSVMKKVMALKKEDIQEQLGPYLSADAIQSTCSRLEEMQEAIRKNEHETEFVVVDDTKPVENLSDGESVKLADHMETVAKNKYNKCRNDYGNKALPFFGGFYGSIFY